jgi:hypothetical protein
VLVGFLGKERLARAALPVVLFDDGTVLEAPSPFELAELQVRPPEEVYDAVIMGAGPAGVAAAVYGASEGLSTLVVERRALPELLDVFPQPDGVASDARRAGGDEFADRELRARQNRPVSLGGAPRRGQHANRERARPLGGGSTRQGGRSWRSARR